MYIDDYSRWPTNAIEKQRIGGSFIAGAEFKIGIRTEFKIGIGFRSKKNRRKIERPIFAGDEKKPIYAGDEKKPRTAENSVIIRRGSVDRQRFAGGTAAIDETTQSVWNFGAFGTGSGTGQTSKFDQWRQPN